MLEVALERALFERAAWLDQACVADPDLRREVELLLASYEEAQGFMENTLPMLSAEVFAEDEAFSVVGQRIGSYEVMREIGRGGMGAVYLAVRADDQYRKRVAIKLVKRGMDTRAILRRFTMKRQILANLDHPNIARLLDGGTTQDGLPYFVMEYIEGAPLDQYCDTHKLSTTERLKLFRTVCSAVHYAHQNLVVHRDLKPSNIIVTADGVPKLLDFGIAKLLQPELFSQSIAPTATIARLMTPDYASPEQVRGQPITTASDIYSLGVLLYELLTGHRPYRVKTYLPQEIERIICEEEPERPSTVISRTEEVATADGMERITLTPQSVSETREGQPEKLRRRLTGDLDNIVLKALRKEPQRRYSSVEQFSQDIQRHLDGLPVIARKDTFSYRSAKFIKRHRAAVATATLFAVTIIAFGLTAWMQSVRAARERDKAQQVSAFLINLFKVSDPDEAKGNTITAREILDQGAAQIEQELKNEPEVQAALMNTMGQVYENLGLYASALPLLQRALQTRRQMLGDEHSQVAESLMHLASVQERRADYAGAEASLHEALAIRRRLYGNKHADVALTLRQLGTLLRNRRDYTSAEPVFREMLSIRRHLYGNEHPEVIDALNLLAIVIDYQGDYAAAESLYREALALSRKLMGNESTETARTLNNLATLRKVRGDFAEAEQLHREALTIRRKAYGDNHSTVVMSLKNLALLFEEQKDFASAERFYREALGVQRKLFGHEHPALAAALRDLGVFLLYGRGNHNDAEPLLREALMIQRKLLGDEHPEVSITLGALGVTLYEKQDLAEAETLLRQSLSLQRQKLPSTDPARFFPPLALGKVLIERGDYVAAEPLLREALQIFNDLKVRAEYLGADARSTLGGCLIALHRYQEAEPLLVQSYEILKMESGGLRDEMREQARLRLVKLYQGLGRPGKAAQYRL